MTKIERLEQQLDIEKKSAEIEDVIHTWACPVCGSRLDGRVGRYGHGDGAEVRSYVTCSNCKCFHYFSRWHSFYDSRYAGVNSGEEVVQHVSKYIKDFYISK